MFFRLYTLIIVGLTAGGVLALPAADPGTLSVRQSFTGTVTWFLQFLQGGVAGACGKVHKDIDHVVSLQTQEYANGILPVADFDSPTARQSFTGTATWFFQGGVAGACGHVHRDTDHVVALQTQEYANGIHCGATITITDRNTGKTATGVVADECPGCNGPGSIDLSQGLFEVFAPLSDGVFPVSWHF